MSILLTIITLTILIIYFISSKRKNENKKVGRFLNRFKMRFKEKRIVREKLSERYSNALMLDPETNIIIKSWYSEEDLREKADIHRARLSKYGKSKMNGEMLFMGPKGGIYKYNSEGKKKYI